MIRIERWLLSHRAEREKRIASAAQENAYRYLQELPPIPRSPIIVLDHTTGTSIQVYKAEASKKLVLIVPGAGSTGQKLKYDFLISDLLRHGISVARTNNMYHPDATADQTYSEAYVNYMSSHLHALSIYLKESHNLQEDTETHIVATSAGASGVLAVPYAFIPSPISLTVIGPSANAGIEHILPGIMNYVASGGKIHALVGELDGFRYTDPYLTLAQLCKSLDISSLSAGIVRGGDHALDDHKTYTAYLAVHRETFRSLGEPYSQFDDLCGRYEYIDFSS